MAETALRQYQRLESLGLWKESEDQQRREVVVSFGAASLVLSDANGKPLTHWSLAAVRTLRAGVLPALYAPDTDSSEVLEIEDEAMVEAIARIRARIRKSGPHPGRLRWLVAGAMAAVIAILLFVWLPRVSADYAARVMPAAKSEEIGEDLLAEATRLSGQPCLASEATDALHRFERWLLPPGGKVHVVDLGARFSSHLPDGQILLNRLLFEEYAGPEVAAGFVLMEHALMQQNNPMRGLFHHIGTRATLSFLANGNLPENALAAYARERLTAPMELPSAALLVPQFARTDLTVGPFAHALDPTGAATAELIAADPIAQGYAPGIDDADWITLQSICGDG